MDRARARYGGDMRSLGLLLLMASPAFSQPAREPLVAQVKNGIERGVKFLRDYQRADGTWEIRYIQPVKEGGQTCLATLALLNCGVPVDDKTVQNGLAYVRHLKS